MPENIERKIEDLMSEDEFSGLGELVKLGKKATSMLVEILSKHSDPLMRKRAAIALGRIQDKAAVKPLVDSLADKNVTVVISVIDSLAILGEKVASQNIVPLLRNTDPSMRKHAARALGNMGMKEAKADLEELSEKDEYDFVRKECSEALKKLLDETEREFAIANCAEGLGFFDQECKDKEGKRYSVIDKLVLYEDKQTCKAFDMCGIQAHAGYYVIGSGGKGFECDIDEYPILYLTMKAEKDTDTCLHLVVHEKKPRDFMRRFVAIGTTESEKKHYGVRPAEDCFTIKDDNEWHEYTYDLRKLRGMYQDAKTVRMGQFYSGKLCKGIPHAFHFSICLEFQGEMKHVSYYISGNNLVISNSHYIAYIDRTNGELSSVFDHNPDGSYGNIAVSVDRLRIRTSGLSQIVFSSALSALRVDVDEAYDFYTKVTTLAKVEDPNASLYVRRTYEFTRNKNIYEQVAFYVSESCLPHKSVLIDELDWLIVTGTGREEVFAATTADDLFIEYPDGPLGGLSSSLWGKKFRTNFALPAPFERILVSGGDFFQTRSRANIWAGHVFLVDAVISIGSPGDVPPDSADFDNKVYQFYPDFGLRSGGYHFTFIDWNKYTTNHFIPVMNEVQEDFLIRISMHLRRRMELDGGWPKYPKWSKYPHGDIFTAHSRSFPQLAYLWAHLTLKHYRDNWVHEPSDADIIYHQLQKLQDYYLPSSPKHFEDLIKPDKRIPYISYSAAKKERNSKKGPRGVLNTHAHALHFAWIMREASKLYGDSEIEQKWREIIAKYHVGSKELFRRLYPGQAKKGGPSIGGMVNYSRGTPRIHPGGKSSCYNTISFEGIASGYLQAQEYEPEFVDAVEHASREDYDPYKPGHQDAKTEPFVARLCRVLPVALSFIGDEIRMSKAIGAAGIKEVLTYAELKRDPATAPDANPGHNPQKFIVEGGGRKLILTNKSFVSDWVPGFWEEKTPDEIPQNLRFQVYVKHSRGGHVGNWAAYRMNNRIEIMTDFDDAHITLKFPAREIMYTGYRDYDENTFKWGYSVNETWTGSELIYSCVPKKRLIFIELVDPTRKATLKGNVSDSKGPISGAKVFVNGKRTNTDGYGDYTLSLLVVPGVPQGVEVFKSGYEPEGRSVTVRPGQTKIVDFTLIKGTVR